MTTKEINQELNEFMTYIGNPTIDTSVIVGMLRHAENINLPVVKWGKQTFIDFVKGLHIVSVGNYYQRRNIFDRYLDFASKKYGIEKSNIEFDSKDLYEVLDIDLMLRTTITNEQYLEILQAMIEAQYDKDKIFNIRDRVIFELSWLGLTSREIKMLKKKDIVFEGVNGHPTALVKIRDNQFPTMDMQLINDIRECIITDTYKVFTKAGVIKPYELLDSEYLIRPIKVGKIKDSDGTLANPSESLRVAIMKNNITCNNFDISALNNENIKRSKILYMLSLNHGTNSDVKYVAKMYDMRNENDAYVLKKISDIKYKK